MRRLSIAVASLALVAAGTLAVSHPSAAAPAGEHRLIAALLHKRASAILSGNQHAFMSTVGGPARFRRAQLRFFHGLRSLPLGGYRLKAQWDAFGDLTRARDRKAHPSASEVSIPLTEERYRLRGFDPRPASEDMYYTYARVRGDWKIVSDSDVRDIGFTSASHLWDFGRMLVHRSHRLLLIEGSCGPAVPGHCLQPPSGLLSLESYALRQVDAYWPGRWSRRVVLLAPASRAELRRLLQADFDLENFVAFAYSTIDATHAFRLTGDRIILNPPAIEDRTRATLQLVLSHELTHIATRPLAGPFVPAFLDEGVAEWVGYRGAGTSFGYLRERAAEGHREGRLPKDYEFTTGSGDDIFDAYQRAHSALSYFIDRFGMAKVVQLYARLGAARVVPGTATFHLERAFRAVTGISLKRFEQDWAATIQG